MAAPSSKRTPTLADIDALPPELVGEIIDGVLYTRNRPSAAHQLAVTRIGGDLDRAFGRGIDGPGGWWILTDPALALVDSPHVVPDVAGWRRERMPAMPLGAFATVPDWICEVLSPTTRRHDVLIKMPKYARVGVASAWLVDVESRMVTVHRLEAGHWLSIGAYSEEREARIPPFESVALDVAGWWAQPADESEERAT